MTYLTEISRYYQSREAAFEYLLSRGFLFMPNGWENGRWMATIEHEGHEVLVSIWLRAQAAA
jgi:hypothetical protein